jgi:hypothetical protein
MTHSWLLYLLIPLAVILIIFIILNLLRKWYWDTIQSNLLDLAEDIGGQVMRRGFFSRPVYHGKYRDADLTINFSGERNNKGRTNLIDISLAAKLNESVTISSYPWLQEIAEKSITDYQPLPGSDPPLYGIRLADSSKFRTKLNRTDFTGSIGQLHPFRFIFISPRGILFEKEAEHLPQNTRHPRLKEQLDGIFKLINGLQA